MPVYDARNGVGGELINLDTGKPIPFARWCNTDTGEWEAFVPGPDGKRTKQLVRGRGRIQFIPGSSVKAPQAKTPSLIPQAIRGVHRQRVLALPNRPCQRYGCNRLADYRVADEQLLDPTIVNNRKYETAKLVGIRYYCAFHYLLPRTFDKKMELIGETEVKARPD